MRFHAGEHAEALTEFEAAVSADPSDLDALYYRGVTRGRLHQTAGAIDDLRAVHTARPSLDRAALELGIALVDGERDRDALAPLEQAQRNSELATQAAYFLGIARLRLGQNRAAMEEFERAATDNDLRLPARYYEGVARARLQRWVTARERFEYVISKDPESKFGKEAAELPRRPPALSNLRVDRLRLRQQRPARPGERIVGSRPSASATRATARWSSASAPPTCRG